MGTKIFEKYGIHVKRFYGGEDRGVCYQITVNRFEGCAWTQLTRKEYEDLLYCLTDSVVNEWEARRKQLESVEAVHFSRDSK